MYIEKLKARISQQMNKTEKKERKKKQNKNKQKNLVDLHYKKLKT